MGIAHFFDVTIKAFVHLFYYIPMEYFIIIRRLHVLPFWYNLVRYHDFAFDVYISFGKGFFAFPTGMLKQRNKCIQKMAERSRIFS